MRGKFVIWNNCWIQLRKCKNLLRFFDIYDNKMKSLGLELLVGQKKQFINVSLGSWIFFISIFEIFLSIHLENHQQMNL